MQKITDCISIVNVVQGASPSLMAAIGQSVTHLPQAVHAAMSTIRALFLPPWLSSVNKRNGQAATQRPQPEQRSWSMHTCFIIPDPFASM